MDLAFDAVVWHWRGPSPYHFVSVPSDEAEELRTVAAHVTYGWGMIPVTAQVGETEWTTSLFPKNGTYAVPLRDAVRRAEELEVGQTIAVHLRVDLA
jgi:Domain of unknown function (DUF1905)